VHESVEGELVCDHVGTYFDCDVYVCRQVLWSRVLYFTDLYRQRIRIRSSKSQIKTLHMGCRIEGMSSNTGGKSKRWSLTEGGGKSWYVLNVLVKTGLELTIYFIFYFI
jgi:hypothetical protein